MPRRTSSLLLLLTTALALASLRAPVALAAWPHDPYSANLLLGMEPGNQYNAAPLPDGAGGLFVAWEDSRSGTYDLYAQHLDAGGKPLWNATGVIVSNAAGNQYNPRMVSDGAGGFIVLWEDSRSGVYNLYAQRVNASGTSLWTANGVAFCISTGSKYMRGAVADGAGGVEVAWEDVRAGNSDIYAQRIGAAGTPLWTANGVALCTLASAQTVPRFASDGAGGLIVAWQDARGADVDVYAQRVTAAGTAAWTLNGIVVSNAANAQIVTGVVSDGVGGAIVVCDDARAGATSDVYAQRVTSTGGLLWSVPVCTATNSQYDSRLVTDGAGGAIVLWEDTRTNVAETDLYAQRIAASGAALWTLNGVAVCTATGQQYVGEAMPDGQGGLIASWEDWRSGLGGDVYAQRLSASGVAQWTANGVGLCQAVGVQSDPRVASDGQGGAIAFWEDQRSTTMDVYAQRVDHTGQLGTPEPGITSVRDVPADQGGAVKVSWTASWLDVDPTFLVFDYRVWRSVPLATAAGRALAARRGTTVSPDEAVRSGRLLLPASGVTDYAWEFVASTPSAQLASYSMVVPTAQDSVGGFLKYTAFMIEARSSSSAAADRWYSQPDSGYSVDNLAPVTPAPLTGTYRAGATHLSWNPNHEADLAGYKLYRGTSPSFVPSPATLIASPPDTGWVDAASATVTYKLTAVDAHGNESAPATLLPAAIAAVGDADARAFFAAPSPNPARAGSVLRFGLAAAGRVRLELLDAAGRRVRTLADGAFAAGEQVVRWDGRDDAGRAMAPGLYFARLTAPGRSETRRLAVVE